MRAQAQFLSEAKSCPRKLSPLAPWFLHRVVNVQLLLIGMELDLNIVFGHLRDQSPAAAQESANTFWPVQSVSSFCSFQLLR